MKSLRARLGWGRCILAAAALAVSCPAFGIVIHPDDTGITDTPDNAIVGRWSSNASCVVIGSRYVLTTRHQGGGVGTPVVINNVTYTVSQVWNAPGLYDANYGGDLMIASLTGAHFTQFAQVSSVLPDIGSTATIGGYGRVRGADRYDANGVLYGYDWGGSDNNNTELWGANMIDSAVWQADWVHGFISPTFKDDFDSPGDPTAVPHEAAVADHDSGGGWFEKSGSDWYVVGISRGGTIHDSSTWFDDPNTANYDPDKANAVIVGMYASWIESIPEPATLVLLGAGGALLLSRRRNGRA